VDHAVGGGRAGAEAVDVFQRAAMGLRARPLERLRRRLGSREAGDLVPASSSSRTIAEPMNPVAPVTKTFMVVSLVSLMSVTDVTIAER
jgi:hypothetical protein